MQLSEKIANLRKQQGWSQEDLAERMGVSRQSVSKWESGASVPELDRIVQLCDLFGVSADSLIRDDSAPSAEDQKKGPEIDMDYTVLTLEGTYAYFAQCQIFAHEIGLGVAACILSPAPLITLTGMFGSGLGTALGVPLLLLIVAWAVYRFIIAGTEMQKYRYIELGRFMPVRGVMQWVRENLDQFRSTFVREISIGTVLCIISPAPLIFLSSFLPYDPWASGLGVALLLALVAAGCYLFTRTGCIQTCYKRLLKER